MTIDKQRGECMLSFFPVPYLEETYYSIIARYHLYSGNPSISHTKEDLFSNKNAIMNTDLANNVDILLKKLPSDYLSFENILYDYSLLPYYAAFIPVKRVKNAENIMRHRSKGQYLESLLGINGSTIINSRSFKHCIECIGEDMEKHNETYWHRVHQLPGVFICPLHKRSLIQYNKRFYEINKREILYASPNLIKKSKEYTISSKSFKALTKIAEESQWLLENKILMPHINFYSEQYIAVLQNNKIATVNGSVNREKWINLFKSYHNKELLSLLESGISGKQGKSWLDGILRQHKFLFHPLRHILVITSLFDTLQEFFLEHHKYNPFGQGPWPCLNAAHSHYKERTITQVNIKRSSSMQPSGTFACDCGFIYSRRGPDKDEDDHYKRGRVVEFGFVWEKELRRLLNKKLPTTEIARLLGVVPSTIRRKKKQTDNIVIKQDNNFSLIKDAEMRKKWLQLVEDNPLLTESELSRIDRRLHYWLYNNDYKWLKKNAPTTPIKKPAGRKADWNKIDIELYYEVSKIINDWDENETKMVKRISKYSIAKQTIQPHRITQNDDKIPETMKLINSVIEPTK